MRILALIAAAAAVLAIALLPGGEEAAVGEPVVIAPPPASAATAGVVSEVERPPAALPALVLHGVSLGSASGGGAILGFPNAGQRGVAVGREFLPGVRLKAVGAGHAVIEAAGGEVTLAFAGQAAPQSGSGAPVEGAAATTAEATLDFRLGMKPMSVGGVGGYQIRPDAKLAALERAGLRAGDVILGVNGSRLDQERLLELAWEIENSDRVEFEYVRGGVKEKASIANN